MENNVDAMEKNFNKIKGYVWQNNACERACVHPFRIYNQILNEAVDHGINIAFSILMRIQRSE